MVDTTEIYRGGTLIIPLECINVDGEEYIFQEDDKVLFAIKKNSENPKSVLMEEIKPKVGETSTQVIFTAEQTKELTGNSYILQVDLINKNGTFPMFLAKLKVIGCAIENNEVGG